MANNPQNTLTTFGKLANMKMEQFHKIQEQLKMMIWNVSWKKLGRLFLRNKSYKQDSVENKILYAWFSKKMYFAMPPMGLANFGILYKLVDSEEEVLTTCVCDVEIQPSDYLFDDMKYLGKVIKDSGRQLLPC